MATYWRISNHTDLSGEGGRYASSRWHSRGSRIVFLAESPAAALCEVLVHLECDMEAIPDSHTLLKISAPDALPVHLIDPTELSDWHSNERGTRSLGDGWLRSCATVLARVPSAVVPYTWNYLLNPAHPEALQLQIVESCREKCDSRLFRFEPR
ncbi:RES family NAD+ phosphorylase [Telmatobacter bradus]|uniref:RES family NAD+ phosphorylase n=1 Tax=Telmatobacter bradus TaxID=474953 RepID=UPI003B429014